MSTRIHAPVRIHLVRHGETDWSRSGRHTGRSDLLLTARGEDEARALAPRLKNIPFTQVLTSPRQRARQTSVLAGLGPAAEIDPDLAEWDYGDYEGQSSADIHDQHEDWNLFRDGCPQGETPAQIFERADRLLTRLRALEGSVALFSHGHFGCVLAARWIGLSVIDAQHFQLGTASLSILGYAGHASSVPVIVLWNATAADSPAPEALADAAVVATMQQQDRERERIEDDEERRVDTVSSRLARRPDEAASTGGRQ